MTFRERLTRDEKRHKFLPLVATVLHSGKLELPEEQRLSPKEALRLANWILDTFGETP